MTTSSTSLLPLTNLNESSPDRLKLCRPDSNPPSARSSSKSRQLSRQGSRIITKDLTPSSHSDDNETVSTSGGLHSRQSSESSKKLSNKVSHALSVKSPRTSHNSRKHIHLERSSCSYISSDSDIDSEEHLSCKRAIEKSRRERRMRGRSPIVCPAESIDSKSFLGSREEKNSGTSQGKLKATETRKALLESKVMKERKCDFIEGRSVESIRLRPQWTGLKRQIVFSMGPVSSFSTSILLFLYLSISPSLPLYCSFSTSLLLFLYLSIALSLPLSCSFSTSLLVSLYISITLYLPSSLFQTPSPLSVSLYLFLYPFIFLLPSLLSIFPLSRNHSLPTVFNFSIL